MDNKMTNQEVIAAIIEHGPPLIREASVLIKRQFLEKSYSLTTKSDSSPVTSADIECEQFIISQLRLVAPHVPILAEESNSRLSGKESEDLFFVVDPIDGTSNYSCGIPLFSISIALFLGSQPLVALLYDPMHDELFMASKGSGATLNAKPITCRDTVDIKAAYVNLNVAKLDLAIGSSFQANVGRSTKKLRCMGCVSLEIAWIAAGRIDAVVNHFLSIWDIGAAVLILAEAGGAWSQLDGHLPRPPYKERFAVVAACTKDLHQSIVAFASPHE